ESLRLYEEALDLTRDVNDRKTEGATLTNLAILYLNQGQPDEAREYSTQALAIHRQIKDLRFAAITLRTMAMLERKTQDDFDKAHQLIEEAISIFHDIGDTVWFGISCCELGHLNLAKQRSARDNLDEAKHIAREAQVKSESDFGIAIAHLEKAQDLFEAGKHQFLIRGECWECITEEFKQWLVKTGQVDQNQEFLR
ncbi:tetratricopeptide repeat protein, partial [candidate division CSSED10-310 bacterium]